MGRVLFYTSLGALITACALVYDSSRAAESPSPPMDAKPAEVVLTEEAAGLLDKWGGQAGYRGRAFEKIQEALKVNPNYPNAYYVLARYYAADGFINDNAYKPGSLEAAVGAAQKALAVDPHFSEANVYMGWLYAQMKDFPKAQAALDEAKQMGSKSIWLDLNQAELYWRQQQFDKAAPIYKAIAANEKRNSKALGTAYRNLINYYCRKDDRKHADEMYQSLLTLDPRSAWTRGDYAMSLIYWFGDFDAGIAKAREALALLDYPMGRYTLAFALYGKWATLTLAKRDAVVAEQYFEEAVTLLPVASVISSPWITSPKFRPILDALKASGRAP